MPRLNGIAATRELSQRVPRVKVIGLSMCDAAEMGPRMREAGAAAYLNKAGPSQDLIARHPGLLPPASRPRRKPRVRTPWGRPGTCKSVLGNTRLGSSL